MDPGEERKKCFRVTEERSRPAPFKMKNTCFVLQRQRQASAEVPLCSKAPSFFLLLRTSFLPAQIPLAAAQWALWEKLLAPAPHPGPALSCLFLDSSVRGTPAFCQDAEEVGVVLLTIWHRAGGSVHTLAVWNHIQSFWALCVKTKQTERKGKECALFTHLVRSFTSSGKSGPRSILFSF